MEGDLILLARVSGDVREALLRALSRHALDRRLGGMLFAPCNWHQSLSNRHRRQEEQALRHAGTLAAATATAFDVVFNRFASSTGPDGRIHWMACTRGAKPAGLTAVLDAVRTGLAASAIHESSGHTGHVTLCYRAPEPLAASLPIAPVPWTVDAVELVRAGGDPYRYTTLERWALQPQRQPALF